MSSPNAPVVILTGASRGLGLAILRILLEKHNARIATLNRSSPPEFTELILKFKERVLPITGDVASAEICEKTVKSTVEKWGRLDALILNAASLDPIAKIADLPLSKVTPYIEINLTSLIYIIQPALPHLRRAKGQEPGRIVCVSTGASTNGYQGLGLYSMVKAGMNSICRTLKNEEGANGVAAYAIRPGMVDTPVSPAVLGRKWRWTMLTSQMQGYIRETGDGHLAAEVYSNFVNAHESGALLPADKPGAVLAALAVRGPADLTGEFMDWQDPRLAHLVE